jgi:FkbM family methyltransferase
VARPPTDSTVHQVPGEAFVKYILDIGACAGEVTRILLENIPSLEYCVMVEPVAENFDFLMRNFAKDKNIAILPDAVFYGRDTLSIGKIIGDNINAGGGSMYSDKEAETVDTVTIEEMGIPFDFVKIDVEGAERMILDNSTQLKNTKFIEVEFHHYDTTLQYSENRIPYLEIALPNHKAVLIGERNIFLQLK